mgnify:CR=1 FL=1|tara:strand:+ start:854 stop:1645 length:792 start_codon:yes stop_codon:yes gene_type:complete
MICLIFGDTDFPHKVFKNIKKQKVNYFIIDLSKKNIFKKYKNSNKISIGQFGKMIKLMKIYKCKKVLFAGKIDKPKFSHLRMDVKGFYYLPRIIRAAKLGDAAIIKVIIDVLKKEKINVISSLTFSPELSLKKGNYTKTKPNKVDILAIKKGKEYLNKLNSHNHVQGLIIRDGKIHKTETLTGTKNMLLAIKIDKKKRDILIKLPKIKQDLRIDLPTIGLDTLIDCKKAGLTGIVLKNNQNIFLDREKCIKFANKNKIFINVI